MENYTFKQFMNRILLSFTFMLFLGVANASAADKAGPQVLLEETINEILKLLYDEPETAMTNDEKNEKLLEIMDSRFPIGVIVKRALGRNWKKLNPEQQEQFTMLFSKLLVNSYTGRLDNSVDRPEFNFLKTIELKKGRMEIQSVITYSGEKFAVNYRLITNNERWEIYDIVVEGVSMLTNYRKQFDSLLSRSSPDELLNLLKAKIAKF